ncbi:hypothetical protein HanIR_Chr07g0328861 [Helianthus annuus]|nr:hypothetical protein HanIR_Chr07g0328861 [Helianthus annuus]
MTIFVYEGLKASTLKFMTFRVTIKLPKDLTKFGYVLRPLKVKLEGSKCKKSC